MTDNADCEHCRDLQAENARLHRQLDRYRIEPEVEHWISRHDMQPGIEHLDQTGFSDGMI